MVKLSLRGQNLGYGQGWTPLLFQDVQANTTITVDVWVKNLCPESNLNK